MIKLREWRIDKKLPGDKNGIGVSRAWEWEEHGVVTEGNTRSLRGWCFLYNDYGAGYRKLHVIK